MDVSERTACFKLLRQVLAVRILAVVQPLQMREDRTAFSPPGIHDPQVERACDIDVTALPRIVLPESQTTVTGPKGNAGAAMLIRPLSADLHRGSRARVDHLDRASI